MSIPQAAKPAKLLIGAFMPEQNMFAPVAKALTQHFGTVDLVSPWLQFDYTDYYTAEMGRPLYRRVLAFKRLIAQSALADIKLWTNALEQQYAPEGRRRVNIDPGYLVLERLVLATGKNFTHRIYVGKGIYADLTLMYTKGAYRPLPWTYPDYTAPAMLQFLQCVRRQYMLDLKLSGNTPAPAGPALY